MDWSTVVSCTPKEELERLEFYCKSAQCSHTAIEIGSYYGASTVLIANYFNPVFAIDPFGEQLPEGVGFFQNLGAEPFFQDFLATLNKFKLADHVYPILSTSKCFEEIPILEAGLIFVDGPHVYNLTLQDMYRAKRHLHPNGLMVVHDYMRIGFGYPPKIDHPYSQLDFDPYIGVKKAVDEFLEKEPFEIFDVFSGIIALRKK